MATTTKSNLITNFDDIALPKGKTNQAQAEREPTLFWLNVGVERGDKLVQLPSGIPLDKLVARKIPSASTKNVEFRQLRQAEAQLWAKVQELMASLKPGESVKLPFTVELRRVEEGSQETTEAETEANPFAAGIADLF